MEEGRMKVIVSDVMSDFYNQVMKKRFDEIDTKFEKIDKRFEKIDKRFDHLDHEITDLRLTNTALVKIVDYARLEAKVIELEDRLKKLEQ